MSIAVLATKVLPSWHTKFSYIVLKSYGSAAVDNSHGFPTNSIFRFKRGKKIISESYSDWEKLLS